MQPRHLAAAGIAMLALGVAAWWWGDAAPPPAPSTAAQAGPAPALASPFGSGPAVLGPDTTAPPTQVAATPAPPTSTPAPAENGMAPGLSLAELQELKAQIGSPGSARDEAGRMAEHLLFSDASLRLNHLRVAGGDPAEMRGLAQLVDEGLDAQLDRGEITREQALELKAAVLQVTVPEPVRRQQFLADWQSRHPQR